MIRNPIVQGCAIAVLVALAVACAVWLPAHLPLETAERCYEVQWSPTHRDTTDAAWIEVLEVDSTGARVRFHRSGSIDGTAAGVRSVLRVERCP